MQKAGGCAMINLASVHSHSGMPDYAVYAATKGAVAALTRHLAVELAPQKGRVNAIAPGLIEVPRYHETIPDYNLAIFAATVPRGRLGEPADIGHLAAFLASDDADFSTGQTIYMDSGTSAYMSFATHLDGQEWRAAEKPDSPRACRSNQAGNLSG